MKLRACLSSLVLLSMSGLASAQQPRPAKGAEAGTDIALVGGDVHTVSGAVIPHGTVVIRGERILSVGKDVAVPASARVIDCKGKVITPGLVESETAIGLVEISLEPTTVDNQPRWHDPVRAAVSAADAVDLRSTLIPVARRHGLTSVVAVPSGGIFAGRSAWVDLVGPKSRVLDRAVKGSVAMHAALGANAAQSIGGSRALAVMRFREALDDARVFKRERNAFNRNQLYKLVTSRLDLAALQPVIDGTMRVVINVSRAADITTVLELARTEKLKVAIVGADEAWIVADQLAAAKVPVIIEPLSNLPDSYESKNARLDNVTLLAKAGVKVAIATRSSHQASSLRFTLGNAVRAGLPPALALRAATLTPAEIYGQEKQYGSIEAGKAANLVVWTGDPFEPASFAETVIVRGEIQPTDTRQTHLSQRYIERYNLDKRPR